MAATKEVIDPATLPPSEPMPPPRSSDPGKAGKFTIGQTSIHSENGVSDIDKPREDEPAEPAADAPAATADKPVVDKPADKPATPAPASSAEPAQPSAKFGSSLPQAQPTATPTATPTGAPAASPASPADKITLDDILKAEGYDDAFITMAKIYKKEGKLDRFVQAMGTDFNKMSDEQVLRESLVRENPDATPEQLEVLVESEIKDKYKLDPEAFDPTGKEAKAARVKMELDAKRARTKLIQENEPFKLPSRDVTAEATQKANAAALADQQATEKFLNQPYIKSVLTDKKASFKGLSITGENGKVTTIPDFHIELEDPTEVQRFMTDGGKTFQKYTTNPDGTRDDEALSQIGVFAINRKEFIQRWINYGKSLGKEELIEEKSNPPTSTERSPGGESKGTLKEAFKTGKHGTAG